MPKSGGCFYTCVCSSSTCAIGAGWGASASLVTIFAFVFVGNICLCMYGLALRHCLGHVFLWLPSAVLPRLRFFPHTRDFCASFGEFCSCLVLFLRWGSVCGVLSLALPTAPAVLRGSPTTGYPSGFTASFLCFSCAGWLAAVQCSAPCVGVLS